MNTRIKKLRKILKMTQEDFGSRVGVKGNTIGNYELCLRNPSDAVIHSICREFGVNEEWLRFGKGEMFIEVEDDTAKMVARLLEKTNPFYDLILDIMKTFDELDDNGKQVFYDAVEKLAKNRAQRKNQDN